MEPPSWTFEGGLTTALEYRIVCLPESPTDAVETRTTEESPYKSTNDVPSEPLDDRSETWCRLVRWFVAFHRYPHLDRNARHTLTHTTAKPATPSETRKQKGSNTSKKENKTPAVARFDAWICR